MAAGFAEVNASLAQAQADIGCGLQVQSLFSQQRDADNARADMQWINDKQPARIDAIEAAEVATQRWNKEDLQAQRKLLAASKEGGKPDSNLRANQVQPSAEGDQQRKHAGDFNQPAAAR